MASSPSFRTVTSRMLSQVNHAWVGGPPPSSSIQHTPLTALGVMLKSVCRVAWRTG